MKKHLLGLAIFSFIVVSFALVFTSFYVPESCPVTQIEAIPEPMIEKDTRYKCSKNIEQLEVGNTKFEIISSQYDFETKKLTSQIRMKLKNTEQMPVEISVGTMISTGNKLDSESLEIKASIVNTFDSNENKNELIFVVVNNFTSSKIKHNENLYAHFFLKPEYENDRLNKDYEILEAEPILFVHGKNSIIKK